MRVAHGRIGQQQFLGIANRLAESRCAELEKLLSITIRNWLTRLNLRCRCWLASNLSPRFLDEFVAVDDRIGNETQESRGSVTTLGQLK